MNLDFEVEGPKLMMLLYGIIAFLAIVGLLLLALDKVSSRKDRWIAMGFLAPAGVLLTIGLIIPLFRTIFLSLMNTDSTSFVGLENYAWMFSQPDNRKVLFNT